MSVAPWTPGTTPSDLMWASTTDPVLALAIVGISSMYALGSDRLRRHGAGHGLGRLHRWAFITGMALLVLALVSPLEHLAGQLLSAHMVQHLLLILGAAPLLAAGRPQLVVPQALPPRARRRLARLRRHLPARTGSAGVPIALIAVTAAHVFTLWAWHAPLFYGLALRQAQVHAVEHLWFTGTALVLWMLLLRPGRRTRIGHGTAVLCLAGILMGGGILGALMTFARAPLYPHYSRTAAWGLTALEDQQLAGVIMWVPSAVFYGIAAAVLFFRWLDSLEAWTQRREARSP